MNNYSERAMRSKGNKAVKRVKEEPTKPVKKEETTLIHSKIVGYIDYFLLGLNIIYVIIMLGG